MKGDGSSSVYHNNTSCDSSNQFNGPVENVHLFCRRRTSKDDRCLQDLRTTDLEDDKVSIEEAQDRLLPDVSCWVLDNIDFKQWRDENNSRLLLIEGGRGKGKTMLLCGIIDELRPGTKLANNEFSTLLSFAFCQGQKATNVLRGLIYLLASQQLSLVSCIQKKYNRAGKQLFEDRNAWVALSKILLKMLEDTRNQQVFLIVDGVDRLGADAAGFIKLAQNSCQRFSHVK